VFVVGVVCCMERAVRRADHSSRGVVTSVVWSPSLLFVKFVNILGTQRA
jgi:hypothetical protein